MTASDAKHVIVIGGGIGGMSSAFALSNSEARPRVTLLESGDRLGGVIESYQADGLTLECGPDSLIRTKPAAMELARALNIPEDAFVGTRPEARTCYTVFRGKLIPVPEGFYLMVPGRLGPWIKTPLISLPGKMRAMLDLFLPRGTDPDESLASFVGRRLGKEVLERLAQPLVAGIYGADPEELSLRATMPQFLEMEAKHRSLILGMRAQRARMQSKGASGARYSLFYSFKNGLQQLTSSLEPVIRERVNVQLNTHVDGLSRQDDGTWQVSMTTGETLTGDAIVLAMPAWRAAPLVAPASGEIAEALETIPYGSVATVNLVYDRSQIQDIPAASGFVVPHSESDALIACTFAHQKYPGRAPHDKVVIRAFAGGSGRDAALTQDDETLTQTCAQQLGQWLKIDGAPEFSLVNRYDKCMAHYTLGHKERIASIREMEKTLPGLALVGNAYEGVGIPDIIAQSNAAAERLMTPTQGR